MDAFEENLFYQLASVFAEARQTFIQRLGMSQARYHLLALLSEKGEIRHAALQQYLLLDGTTITRLVKQFESEGLVSRRLDPQDNRYTFASLTDAGRQTMAEIGEELFAPDFVSHAAGTVGGVRDSLTFLFARYPDIHFVIEDVLVEGDKFALRMTIQGVPHAPEQPQPTLMEFFRSENGRVVEVWGAGRGLPYSK